MRLPRHLRPLALLLIAASAPALAQGPTIEWEAFECAFDPAVGHDVSATVTGELSNASIQWGDGSEVSIAEPGEYGHVYEAPHEDIVATLVDDAGTDTTYEIDVFEYMPVFTPASPLAGTTVQLDFTSDPHDGPFSDGVLVDWGDGEVETPAVPAHGFPIDHVYAASGTYTVTLSDLDDCPYASGDVTVRAPQLTTDPASARIDESITVTLDEEPDDAVLDWDDGDSTSLDGSLSYPHAYDRDGTFVLTVRDASDGTLQYASASVDVLEPALDVQPTAPSVGEPVTAQVVSPPFDGQLDWGDSSAPVDLDGDGSHQHGYESPGSYTVELRRSTGEVVAEANVGVETPSLGLDRAAANVGEAVVATLQNEPSDGRIDWDDGDMTDLTGAGSYEHAFADPGEYTVRLLADDGTSLAEDDVSVVAPSLQLAPDDPRIGEPVEATVSLVGPGTVRWGDGASSSVFGDDTVTHRYASGGGHTAELAIDGTVTVAAPVEVRTPELSIDPEGATLGESVTATVTNAPHEAELSWGDGEVETGVVDGSYLHAYARSGTHHVTLIDARHDADVAVGAVDVADAAERLTVEEVRHLPEDGRIELDLSVTGLVADFPYFVTGGGLFEPIEGEGDVERTVTLFTAGTITLSLYRDDTAGEPRDTVTLDLAWPLEGSVEVASADPIHRGELVRFELTGLEPGYRYVLDVGDGTPFGWEFYEEGVTSAQMAHVYANAGAHEAALYMAPPNTFFSADEIAAQGVAAASVLVDVREVSGQIAFASDEVPYGLESELRLDDLLAGATYRVDFGDGHTESFVATAPSETFIHVYRQLPNDPVLELRDDEFLVWEVVDDAAAPSGMAFSGTVGPQGGGTTLGAEQAFVASELIPGETYEIAALIAGDTAASARGTADAEGTLSVTLTIPNERRQIDDVTEGTARLSLVLSETDVPVRAQRFVLPPLQRSFAGYTVHLTALPGPFTQDQWSEDFRADGVVRDMELGGKVQGDVAFEIRGFFEARAKEALELSLPASLAGLQLTFTELVLARDVVGYETGFVGEGTLHGQRFTVSSDGWVPGFEGRSSIATRALERGDGLLVPAIYEGAFPVGSSDWEIRSSERSNGAFLIDLSQSAGMTYPARSDDYASRMSEAYGGWEEVGRTPPVDPNSDAWRGIQFLYGNRLVSTGSGLERSTPAIAWTSSGFQISHPSTSGTDDDTVDYRGWTMRVVATGRLGIVDSVPVSNAEPIAAIDLPFFDKSLLVRFGVNAAGYAQATPIATPIATDYGATAVLADGASFDVYGNVVFDRAAWALADAYARNPTSLPSDTVAGSIGRTLDEARGDLPDLSLAEGNLVGQLETSAQVLELANSALRLQLPLPRLTLTPDGDVLVDGDTWATLASTPELDLHGFDYLSGGDAQIGVKREGDEYAVGLQGKLNLGGIARADAAPSWYYHREGEELRWHFEGVGVGMGDPRGNIETPVTFNLTVGGILPLDGSEGFELSGSGSLELELGAERGIEVEVAGVFGMNAQGGGDPVPYWFVLAAVGLEPPLYVTAQGADVLAFYQFRGGVGHNLTLDLATGGDDTCAVDDGAGWTPDARPSLAKNALACFDDANDFGLVAGTVVGWPVRGVEALYGYVWHVDANLVVNSSGSVVLGGSGWTMKNVDFGYGRGVAPEMRARISIDGNGIVGSMCVGNVNATIGELDCSSLQPLRYEIAGVTLVEATATAELIASWSGGEGYLALGRYDHPIDIYIIPRRTRGYFVAGRVESAGVIGPPATYVDLQNWSGQWPPPTRTVYPTGTGIWASLEQSTRWTWSDSFDAGVCTVRASATAGYSFEGRFQITFDPDRFRAGVSASADARASVSGCSLDTSVGVALSASGRVEAPNPYRFTGRVTASADLPVIGDISVTVPDVSITL